MRQRNVLFPEILNYAKAIQARHLDVQENDVRLQVFDELDRLQTIAAGSQDLDVGKLLEQVGQFLAGQLFVVNQNGGEGAGSSLSH